MLEIKPQKNYKVAKYLIGKYQVTNRNVSNALIKKGLIPLSFAAIMELCVPIACMGVTDFPDVVPENEARLVINKIFADNDINLIEDYRYILNYNNNNLEYDLDGYNDSLNIGYEYLSRDDSSNDFVEYIDSIGIENEPHLKLIYPEFKDDSYEQRLEAITQQFLDSLKQLGII